MNTLNGLYSLVSESSALETAAGGVLYVVCVILCFHVDYINYLGIKIPKRI